MAVEEEDLVGTNALTNFCRIVDTLFLPKNVYFNPKLPKQLITALFTTMCHSLPVFELPAALGRAKPKVLSGLTVLTVASKHATSKNAKRRKKLLPGQNLPHLIKDNISCRG